DQIVGNDHFDLDLRQKVDHVFGATIEFRVALLPTEALDLGDGESAHADVRQRLANLVELERLDDRFHLLHCLGLLARTRTGSRATLHYAETLFHSAHADVIG